MRTKILASLAIAAATMFTACSDDNPTPPPSKAQLCANGITDDCLMGTWSINGPTLPTVVGTDTVYLVDQNHNLSASPAKLKFYIDDKNAKKFEFVNSTLSKADCITATGKTYGNWEILGSSIHFYANIGNECMEKNDKTIESVVSVSGTDVKLKLKGIFFMEPEIKNEDAVQKALASEEYSFMSEN